MENRIDEIKTPNQHEIAAEYCRQKHPAVFDPSTAMSVTPPESAQLYLVNATDPHNAIARPEIAAIDMVRIAINHDGMEFRGGMKSPDFKWYSRVDITNRNRFPLSAIIVGVPSKKVSQCSWNERYAQVFQCNGYAEAGMSGSFRCDVPSVVDEHGHFQYCIIGLGINGTSDDLKRDLPAK